MNNQILIAELSERIDRGSLVVETLKRKAVDLARDAAMNNNSILVAVTELKNLKAERLRLEKEAIHEGCEEGRCVELNGKGPCNPNAEVKQAYPAGRWA